MLKQFEGALKGIKICDFGWVWAGAYIGELLSFLGADVIKVESRGRVDQTRQGSIMNGDSYEGYDSSPTFNCLNLNKKSVALNIAKPEGQELARRLIAKSDIVIDNMRPGKMKKLGLDYESLKKIKPDIIMLESSGFGASGPYKGFAGFAPIFASFGGLSYLTGYQDGAPNVMSGVHDLRVGTAAAFILTAALINRKRTGKGMYIDASSAECISTLVGPQLMAYTMNGESPFRDGNGDEVWAPHQVYRCKGDDKWVSIAVTNNEEWKAFREVMGNPAWAEKTEYDDVLGRREAREEIDQKVSEWTADLAHDEVMKKCQEKGVAAIPSWSAEEILKDKHIMARGTFGTVDHPVLGLQHVMNPAWRFSETPASIRKSGPCLGEDNDFVYQQIIGLTAEEQKEYEEKQIIW